MLVTWGCARELLGSLSLQQWDNSEAGVWSCSRGGRIAAVCVRLIGRSGTRRGTLRGCQG